MRSVCLAGPSDHYTRSLGQVDYGSDFAPIMLQPSTAPAAALPSYSPTIVPTAPVSAAPVYAAPAPASTSSTVLSAADKIGTFLQNLASKSAQAATAYNVATGLQQIPAAPAGYQLALNAAYANKNTIMLVAGGAVLLFLLMRSRR